MEAAQKAGLSSGESFSIDNFTYINSVVVARMFEHLQNANFLGITVCTYKLTVHCSIYKYMITLLCRVMWWSLMNRGLDR